MRIQKFFIYSLLMTIILLLALSLPVVAVDPPFTFHQIGTYDYCQTVDAADLNGDGAVDIFAASSAAIYLWPNDGSGGFTAASSTRLDTAFPDAVSHYADDLDEDGDLDVVVLSGGGSVAWFENQGGSWKQGDIHPDWLNGDAEVMAPMGIELSGKPLIPLASPLAKGLTVYSIVGYAISPNNATTLSPYIPVGQGIRIEYPSAIYYDDMHGDNDLDIIAASKQTNSRNAPLAWYEYTSGYSSYSQHTIDASFARPIWVRTADLDRDGDPDALAASDTLGLYWWENTDGQATSWSRHEINRYDAYLAESLHLVDVDSDDDLDLLASTKQQLVWLENLGNPAQTGNWNRRAIATLTQFNGYAIYPADINGDGQTDIVSCERRKPGGGGKLGWWENNHQLPSGYEIQFWPASIADNLSGAWGAVVADFNDDGRLDAAASDSTHTRLWFNTSASGDLAWTAAYSNAFSQGRGMTTRFPDRSGSSYLYRGGSHYLVNGHNGWVRSVVRNDTNWNSGLPYDIITDLGETYLSTLADINDDSKLDIITTSAISDSVLYASQKDISGGAYAVTVISNSCDGARSVAACDFNGDGATDVIAACPNENRLHWWENTNQGITWPEKTIPISFPGANDVRCGDIDNDGQMEAVASGAGSYITWFKHNATIGDPNTTDDITTVFTDVEHIHLADLNRDGRLDVVASSNNQQAVYWFENKIATTPSACSPNCFTAHLLPDTLFIDGAHQVTSGDINRDGAPDLVMAGGSYALWYEQGIDVDVTLQKSVLNSTWVVSAGQTIPYNLEITTGGTTTLPIDVMVVDSWQPPDAVAAAAGDGCSPDLAGGVMTCTLFGLTPGTITNLPVVLTPSLLYDGFITNTAEVHTLGLARNVTGGQTKHTLPGVEVQRDDSLYDLLVEPGFFPTESIAPGTAFTYTMHVFNRGPASGTGTLINQWVPVGAIAGFFDLNGSGAASLSAAATDCSLDPGDGTISCNLTGIDPGESVTVTLGVTTSTGFSDTLENSISIVGGSNEGLAANNQSWPIRVGAFPMMNSYLPLILKEQ